VPELVVVELELPEEDVWWWLSVVLVLEDVEVLLDDELDDAVL
jgi:hypothetical protein